MSRSIYWHCDLCHKETELHEGNISYISIHCGNDLDNYPHGDFCSIACVIEYLRNWENGHPNIYMDE